MVNLQKKRWQLWIQIWFSNAVKWNFPKFLACRFASGSVSCPAHHSHSALITTEVPTIGRQDSDTAECSTAAPHCFICLKGFYGCQRILFRSLWNLFHLFFPGWISKAFSRNERVIGAHSAITSLSAARSSSHSTVITARTAAYQTQPTCEPRHFLKTYFGGKVARIVTKFD